MDLAKELEQLPIIDWSLSLKLAGQQPALAKDILAILIKDLAQNLEHIQRLYASKNYVELRSQIHKLHGAVCYCGLPRLKIILFRLETNLKNNIIDSLPSFLDQLNIEVNDLLRHYAHQPNLK